MQKFNLKCKLYNLRGKGEFYCTSNCTSMKQKMLMTEYRW